MTPLLEIVVYFTILTFVTVLLGALLRNREWTAEGRAIGLGNRDNLSEPIYIAGIKVVRSLVWMVGVAGYILMVIELL